MHKTLPPPDATPSHEDLYALYVEFVGKTRREIVVRTLPGTMRDHLLSKNRALPREYFEARLETLKIDRTRYEETVNLLRNGWRAAH